MSPKNSRALRLNKPIGMLLDGKINIIKIDDPPFKPTVLDDSGVPLTDLAKVPNAKVAAPTQGSGATATLPCSLQGRMSN